MYVPDDDGKIRASMAFIREQAREYRQVSWQYPAVDDEVPVIHTLCIPPSASGKGCRTRMSGSPLTLQHYTDAQPSGSAPGFTTVRRSACIRGTDSASRERDG